MPRSPRDCSYIQTFLAACSSEQFIRPVTLKYWSLSKITLFWLGSILFFDFSLVHFTLTARVSPSAEGTLHQWCEIALQILCFTIPNHCLRFDSLSLFLVSSQNEPLLVNMHLISSAQQSEDRDTTHQYKHTPTVNLSTQMYHELQVCVILVDCITHNYEERVAFTLETGISGALRQCPQITSLWFDLPTSEYLSIIIIND